MLEEGYIVAMMWATLALSGFLIIGVTHSSAVSHMSSEIETAFPNCPRKCGNITIPYPFGIGDGCHYDHPIDGHYYNFTCDTTINPPTLSVNGILEVNSVTLDGELWVSHLVAYNCFDKDGKVDNFVSQINLKKRFTISSTQNSLVAIGCNTYAWFGGSGIYNTTVFNSGCIAVCNHAQKDDLVDKCSGIGCCVSFIPGGVNNISIEAKRLSDHSNVLDFNPCGVAFLVAKDAMPSSLGDFLTQNATDFRNMQFPVVHHWSLGTKDCETAKKSGEYICKRNSACYNLSSQRGYHCRCNPGFQGNPYLHDCQDIDECTQGSHNLCTKPAYCVNTRGSYECVCPQGYSGKGTANDPCILDPNHANSHYKLLIGLSVTLGLIVTSLVGWWLYLVIKRHQIVKQRAKYFKRNGGLLLQQEVSSNEFIGTIKIFTIDELEKATDYFNEDRIVGRGGRGTVYKGMLSEGRIVAIKKSMLLEEGNQVAEFINEVVILSQINHRNIVKLLGCCLETEVPLLVYEFIPNGTVFSHIHDPCEEFPISWKLRLQIACDSASALVYLHYSSVLPIFHRDIKSSNILLDDRYRAKLSDFGTSRILATDQTHVTTRVMGTFGYLDPEYFRSSQFTEKSDVYSFGVVLVELITGQKAIRATLEDLEQDRSLISWFLFHMENSRLLDVVDAQVLQEGPKEEFLIIANLAKRCLDLDGKRRPTMKEVLLEIEAVLSLHLPQTSEPNRFESEQVFAGTINDHVISYSSTSDLETTSILSHTDESLLYSPNS